MLSGDYYHVVETITNPGGREGSILPELTAVSLRGFPPLDKHACSHTQKFMLRPKSTQFKNLFSVPLAGLSTILKQKHLQGSLKWLQGQKTPLSTSTKKQEDARIREKYNIRFGILFHVTSPQTICNRGASEPSYKADSDTVSSHVKLKPFPSTCAHETPQIPPSTHVTRYIFEDQSD